MVDFPASHISFRGGSMSRFLLQFFRKKNPPFRLVEMDFATLFSRPKNLKNPWNSWTWNFHIWVFPKIVGFPPKSSIFIGFSIIFTIHFGVLLFLEFHPLLDLLRPWVLWCFICWFWCVQHPTSRVVSPLLALHVWCWSYQWRQRSLKKRGCFWKHDVPEKTDFTHIFLAHIRCSMYSNILSCFLAHPVHRWFSPNLPCFSDPSLTTSALLLPWKFFGEVLVTSHVNFLWNLQKSKRSYRWEYITTHPPRIKNFHDGNENDMVFPTL